MTDYFQAIAKRKRKNILSTTQSNKRKKKYMTEFIHTNILYTVFTLFVIYNKIGMTGAVKSFFFRLISLFKSLW